MHYPRLSDKNYKKYETNPVQLEFNYLEPSSLNRIWRFRSIVRIRQSFWIILVQDIFQLRIPWPFSNFRWIRDFSFWLWGKLLIKKYIWMNIDFGQNIEMTKVSLKWCGTTSAEVEVPVYSMMAHGPLWWDAHGSLLSRC